jgi:hypothetical protein
MAGVGLAAVCAPIILFAVLPGFETFVDLALPSESIWFQWVL